MLLDEQSAIQIIDNMLKESLNEKAKGNKQIYVDIKYIYRNDKK